MPTGMYAVTLLLLGGAFLRPAPRVAAFTTGIVIIVLAYGKEVSHTMTFGCACDVQKLPTHELRSPTSLTHYCDSVTVQIYTSNLGVQLLLFIIAAVTFLRCHCAHEHIPFGNMMQLHNSMPCMCTHPCRLSCRLVST